LTKKKKKAQVIKKRILSIGLKISLFLLSTLIIVVVLISIPAVQTTIINRISDKVFEKINHNIDIEYINIRWFDTVLIQGLLVYDTKNHQMIKMDRLILDFKLGELITKSSINLDKAILQGASVVMINNAPEGQFNLNFFIDEIKTKLVKEKKNKKAKIFHTDKIILTDGRFKMFRNDREIISNRFDQFHFTLENLEANLTDFILQPGIIDFQVDELQCVDSATGLDVKQLQTKFQYTRQSMIFQNMELKAGRTTISQSMVFDYLQPSSIKEFVDSVKITANVKKSLIYSKDLGLFAPALQKYNEYYHFEGFIEGPVNRFNIKNINLRFGLRSELKGYVSMYGLPDIDETFIDAKITEGQVNAGDLAPYANESSMENLQKFGLVRVKGGFAGFPGDFVSNATFDTQIGSFDTDINLKLGKKTNERPTYSGKLSTRNFDLGVLLGDTVIAQTIDMKGSISGSGFTTDDARFYLISTINRIGIKGYDYHNIKTDATLAEQFFNGNLVIDDPNLQFNGNVSIDLNKEHEIIQVKAELGKAVLDTLQITEKPAFLSSTLNVDMRGLSLDNIFGEAYLENTIFRFNESEIFIDRLNLISEKDSLARTLQIQSPFADLSMAGDFDYSTFIQDMINLYKEYKLIFRNDSEEIEAYYAQNVIDKNDDYHLNYDVYLKNINPVINMFMDGFILSENTRLIGSISGGDTKLVELQTEFDTLHFNDVTFIDNSIQFDTKKKSDTTLVFGQYNINSGQQLMKGVPRSDNLICDVNWNGNVIDFNVNLEQSNSSNYIKTAGHVEFLTDTTMLSLLPSEINIIDKIWSVSEQNMIMIRKRNYDIRNLSFYHEDQRITVNGLISEDPNKNLFISIRNFEMEMLNPLISKRLDGIFNGFIDIKDYFNQRQINSRINIRDLNINKFLVGNVVAYSEFDNQNQHFDVNLNVMRNGVQTMLVEGILKPAGIDEQIDLKAKFTNANLNLIEPFFEDFISNVRGTLDGELDINGKLSKPMISGLATTTDGEFTLDYLKTHYKLDGQVLFAENYMDFQNFALIDPYNNSGSLSGKITHNGFQELEYNFAGTLNKFLVLNTTSKDNSSYYGTAFATGNLNINGKEKVLNITANAVTEKGTRFYIPLDGDEEVVQEEFINFLSVRDTIALSNRQDAQKMDLKGISLNFDFEITPDAYCEIIFDLTAGDIIRGRGNGKLNLQIDTKGDFNIFGDYEITEGGYNFTLYNIINKEFQIEPGSQISWIGDPYEAILDIKASYNQLASLTPILRGITEEEIRNNPELNRKYPAKVLLDIKGNLSYPEIVFNIDVTDYPKNAVYNEVSLETYMSAFKTRLATDEQELKRQVFSLIILKNFSQENAFNVGGSVERSVSEFISNQISYWVTQFDENLVVDVDLGSLDNEAFNTFQLRMSYSFLDGRLRVTRDGRFSDETTGANVASILGDWSVEYLLSSDGKLRVKIYNKTNYNTLNPSRNAASTTTGFSLMHTKSFDDIRQLFKNTRVKNRPPEVEEVSPEIPISENGVSQRNND
jgi:hypothetical protein